jgi:membrane protein DedA with SNARE-associated domain
MAEDHAGSAPPDLPGAALHPHLSRRRLSDGQALGLFGAWLVFRTITQRIGIGSPRYLLADFPWVIPLLNNSFVLLIITGTGTAGRPGMLVATGLTSVLMSTIIGLVLYWAGWRFGARLAELSQRPGSPWAGVWNPKQIERAERWMDKWGIAVIVIARITELFYLPVALVAGASEMRFRRFILANTIGAVGFVSVWLWVGGLAQRRYPWLKDWFQDVYGPWALRIGLVLIVLLVLLFALGSRLDKSKTSSETTDDQTLDTTTPSQGSSASPPENDDPSRSRSVDS